MMCLFIYTFNYVTIILLFDLLFPHTTGYKLYAIGSFELNILHAKIAKYSKYSKNYNF